MNLPSKEQLDELKNSTKIISENYDNERIKSNCDYIWKGIVETINKAVKDDTPSIFIHTDIDTNKVNRMLSNSVKDCVVGNKNETIENLLQKSGVELSVRGYTPTSYISYSKIHKIIII